MKEHDEKVTDIEVRGLKSQPSILKKILKVQKWIENFYRDPGPNPDP